MKEIDFCNDFEPTCRIKFPLIFSFVSMDSKPDSIPIFGFIPWTQKSRIMGNFMLEVESKSLQKLISFISM